MERYSHAVDDEGMHFVSPKEKKMIAENSF